MPGGERVGEKPPALGSASSTRPLRLALTSATRVVRQGLGPAGGERGPPRGTQGNLPPRRRRRERRSRHRRGSTARACARASCCVAEVGGRRRPRRSVRGFGLSRGRGPGSRWATVGSDQSAGWPGTRRQNRGSGLGPEWGTHRWKASPAAPPAPSSRGARGRRSRLVPGRRPRESEVGTGGQRQGRQRSGLTGSARKDNVLAGTGGPAEAGLASWNARPTGHLRAKAPRPRPETGETRVLVVEQRVAEVGQTHPGGVSW